MSQDFKRHGPMGMDPALDKFRLEANNQCWWCGEVATTAEHRIKKSTLKRIATSSDGTINPQNIFKKSVNYQGPLKSNNKGAQIRWPANLCGKCNNDTSQPYDKAYDAFEQYVVDYHDEICQKSRLKWADVYGKKHRESSKDLARYFAKQLGCMLATQRLPIPGALIDFLNGADQCRSIGFTLGVSTEATSLRTVLSEEDASSYVGIHKVQAYKRDETLAALVFPYQIGDVHVSTEWRDGERLRSWFHHRAPKLTRVDNSDNLMDLIRSV